MRRAWSRSRPVRVAPKEWPGDVGAAALHLSPDGKFLYASNRTNADDVVIYSVDAQAGTLTPVGHQGSLGAKPRDFCIDPTGKFLVVANQDSALSQALPPPAFQRPRLYPLSRSQSCACIGR